MTEKTSSNEYKTVSNAIITLGDTDDSGKGRHFKSRFIQPGLAGYPGQFGNALIKKENLDKFVHTLRNKPVTINHKDNIGDDDKVGEVLNVWYNPEDGWYWCDGIITDETAINLINDKNWSVSCSYDFIKYDDEGGTENNIPYDIEFLDGEFNHLAIVDNPRYEGANIVFNSKGAVNNFNPNHDIDGKFCSSNGVNPNFKEELKQVIDKAKNNPNERQKLIIGSVTDELAQKAKDNGIDISGYNHDLDVSGTRHAFKEHGTEKTEKPRGQIPIDDTDFEKIPDVIYKADEINFTGKNKTGLETITYKKTMPDNIVFYVEEIRTGQKTLSINTMYKHKNTGNPRTSANNSNPLSNASIHIINDINDNFNPTTIDNAKEQEMALLDELKKLITKVENDKGENMDEKEKDGRSVGAPATADNEKTDKRKLIDEVGGILKGKVDDEIIRTIIGKMEKASYDDSEASADNKKVKNEAEEDEKKADNKKVKNESEEDKEKVKELEKDEKEDVENKCKNSVDNAKDGFFDKLNKIYNSTVEPTKQETEYVSRADRLKAGEEYFKV